MQKFDGAPASAPVLQRAVERAALDRRSRSVYVGDQGNQGDTGE